MGNLKVLLVDDEPSILEQGEVFLERNLEDPEIDRANSAEEAERLLEDSYYDAIVSDYQMPEKDGLELLKTVRQEMDSDLPFIIFTGKGREEVAMEALNLGADRYLRKGGSPKSQYEVLADSLVREIEHYRKEKERERMEEKIELADFTIENANLGALWISPKGEILYANKMICKTLGCESKELEGMKISEIDPNYPDQRPELWEKIKEEGSATFETEHRSKNGETHPVEVTSYYLERGEKEYEFAFVEDITERKEREKELKRYERSVESSDDSIYMIDKERRYVFANKEHISRLKNDGRIPEESEEKVIGKNCSEIHPEVDSKKLDRNIEKVLKTGEPTDAEHKFSDVDRWSSRTFSPVEAPDSDKIEGVIIFSKEITDRKKTEEDIKEAKENYQELFEKSGDALFVHNPDTGEILQVNERTCEMYGIKPGEILGETVEKISSGEENYTIKRAKELIEKAKEEGSQRFEWKAKKKNGDTFWTEVTLKEAEIGGESKIIANAREITERKETKEREEFLHSLLRHDVRNKARTSLCYLDLLKETGLSEEQVELVEKIIKSSKNAISIVEKVRTLRRIGETDEIGAIELKPLLEDIVEDWEPQGSEKSIEINYEKPGCRVKGGALLEEMFSNLLENSIKHSGCNEIKISCEDADSECIVSIDDDGRGIPDETKEKLFDRGYKMGKTGGSGLGLHLVKEIAEAYGGDVKAEDSELGGAKFDVHLKKREGN